MKKYENEYMISKNGEIYSIRKKILMIPQIKNGYASIGLCNNKNKGKQYCVQRHVHRLVAENFLEKPTDIKKPVVDHIDGKKTNNSIDNLRWCSQSTNAKNTYKNNPTLNDKSKIKIIKLDENKNTIEQYDSISEAKRKTNISRTSIIHALKTNTKVSGFFWKLCEPPKKNEEFILKDGEIFKDINNFENYKISNYGNVINKNTNKLVTSSIYEYVSIGLSKSNESTKFLIHILVAEHFIEKPKNYTKHFVVNHLDENKLNNHYTNLEFTTSRLNTVYSIGRKILQIDIKTNEVINKFDSIVDGMLHVGAKSNSCISICCKNEKRTAYGFKWRYA